MELSEFITGTLISIAQGVVQANEKYRALGGEVNPKGFRQIEGGIPYGKQTPGQTEAIPLSNVIFEIALTEESKDNATGGIGVLLGAFGTSGKIENSSETQNVTKVKFNVPVKLP